MHHEHVATRCGAPRGLPEVRLEDGIGRNLCVAEEPIRALQLGVAERLREAVSRPVGKAVDQKPESLGQPGVTELGVSDFG